MVNQKFLDNVQQAVQAALLEDIPNTDITAELISATATATARIVCNQPAVFCGAAWANAAFLSLDNNCHIKWQVKDGAKVKKGSHICTVSGNARALLSAERTALNFLQTLSATASTTLQYVEKISSYPAKILDSRKTIPGLRMAQKYAVTIGGGHNHRQDLSAAFLIKENHILAAGGIAKALAAAKKIAPHKLLEIEVENLDELKQATSASTRADRIMLDNFKLEDIRRAVNDKPYPIDYEASGDITLDNIASVAATKIDYISLGALTKHIQAIDFSMRFINS